MKKKVFPTAFKIHKNEKDNPSDGLFFLIKIINYENQFFDIVIVSTYNNGTEYCQNQSTAFGKQV